MNRIVSFTKPFICLICLIILMISFCCNLNAQINFTSLRSYNYIYSKTILNKTDGGTELKESMQYFDGLGRPKQTIQYKGSPTQKDIVQPIEYDAFGRETNKYLPYTISASGVYRSSWKTEQASFNIGLFGSIDGNKAFSTTIFDNSPQNRIMKQGAPGNTWKVTNTSPDRQPAEHIISYQFTSNTTDEVYYWTITGTLPNIIFTKGTYLPNTLQKNITSDENNNPITEYLDVSGKVVLKKDALGGKTYYIYDDYDLLRCVLPPLASEVLEPLTSFGYNSNTNFWELCYYYEYDTRLRMNKKKLPGTGFYTMYYDDLDRLYRTDDPNGKSFYTTYDAFSRPIETGIYGATSQIWMNKTIYDSYGTYSSTYPYQNIYSASYETAVKGKATVAITRVIDYTAPISGSETQLVTVTYYDKYGRVLQTISQNYMGGRDRISYKYLHKNTDLVSEKRYDHGTSGTTVSRTVIEKFTYDAAGRLLTTKHKIGTLNEETLASLTYNEAGMVTTKLINGFQTDSYTNNIRGWLTIMNNVDNFGPFNLFSERITYSYNGNISKMEWTNNPVWTGNPIPLKVYDFVYDNINRLTSGTYNEYQFGQLLPNSANKYSCSYTYDANGNLKTATNYGVIDDGTGLIGKIDDLTYIYYNNNKSNRLYAIGDLVAGVFQRGDFNETAYPGYSNQEYFYDNNGNMTWDMTRRFKVKYNEINLPQCIYPEAGSTLFKNYFTTSGAKIRQITTVTNTSNITNDYVGPFVYKNNILDYIITSEGRAVYSNGNFSYYEFSIKDHLGNIRSVFKKTGSAPALPLVLQTNEYYPFGMLMGESTGETYGNKYRYNGKENIIPLYTSDPIDISWYDYGARFYDPQIGRWHSVDPMAEQAPDWSPYRYAFNNPINFIDPDGEFETRKEARQYKREHDIDGKVKKDESGLYVVHDYGNNTSYYKDPSLNPAEVGQVAGMGEDGVIQAATVTGEQSAKNRANNVLEGGMAAAAITTQLDSPMPGIADVVGGVIAGGTLITAGTILLIDEIDRLQDQFAAEHTKNKSKSKWNKHSDTRSGGDTQTGRYGRGRNANRGDKNKKYIPDRNPNKRPK